MNDLATYAYSFEDNCFDDVILNEIVESNRPHGLASHDITTKSNIESDPSSALSTKQMRCLERILQSSKNGGYSFEMAANLIHSSELTEFESSSLLTFAAIMSGIFDSLNSMNMETKGMGPKTRAFACNVCAGTLVSVWSSWGEAIAVGLGVCTGGVATVAVAAVSVVGGALMSQVMGC